MHTNETKIRKGEKGFTLVELAIVMIIIGLLITGILKGQEMIANAQVTSTISQLKGLDAAANTFRDSFNAFPGDMANATTRLANCAAPCADGADPSGRLDDGVGPVPASEGIQFFLHMLAADLITGMDGTAPVTFGQSLPAASVGGGFFVGHSSVAVGGFDDTNMRIGHYIVHNGTVDNVAADTGAMVPTQAARVDRKMDDGVPDTGSVHGTDAGNCHDGTVYNEDDDNTTCAIAVRIGS
ncbi:MAG: prepilin-type N-terminal cleavage/methylation domain-containing protein [Micavibrio sp.]|nr:MAG: prepilin-type N-terminal cleavage/methylation domain-containing protein [Micavibrio sp.]